MMSERAAATRMQKDGNQNFLIMHLRAQQTQKTRRRESRQRGSGQNKLKMKTALDCSFVFAL
jgi:hypothetical protein